MAAPEVRLDTPEHISQVYEYYRTPPDRERTLRAYERMNRLWVPRQSWEDGAMEAVREIAEGDDLLTVIKPHDSNHNPFQDAAAGFQITVLHDIIASSGFHIIAKENWYKYRLIRELFDDANAIPASRNKDNYLRRVAAKELIKTCIHRMVEYGEHAWNYPTGHRNKTNPEIVPDELRPGIFEIVRAVEAAGRKIYMLPAGGWSGDSRLRRWTAGGFRPTVAFGMPFEVPKTDEELSRDMLKGMQAQLNIARDQF